MRAISHVENERRLRPRELGDDFPVGRQHPLPVQLGREQPGPGVEELYRLRTRFDLRVQIADHHFRKPQCNQIAVLALNVL